MARCLDPSSTIVGMGSPVRPLPGDVERWIARLGMLRWADATAAWALVYVVVALSFAELRPVTQVVVAAAVVAAGAAAPALRARWRPITAIVGIRLSQGIRPGTRAWYVHRHGADLVLVTARRRLRVIIAGAHESPSETYSVRRTRVLLLPADLA
jgi:hypothetical protein